MDMLSESSEEYLTSDSRGFFFAAGSFAVSVSVASVSAAAVKGVSVSLPADVESVMMTLVCWFPVSCCPCE